MRRRSKHQGSWLSNYVGSSISIQWVDEELGIYRLAEENFDELINLWQNEPVHGDTIQSRGRCPRRHGTKLNLIEHAPVE